MPRTKHSVASHRKKKKILKRAKGFRGARSKLHRTAKESVNKALQYSYRDRKTKKRNFRRLWISRINAAARINGISYSRLIGGLKKADIEIDRKILSEIALNDNKGFEKLVETAKKALS
ncbi:MAG TPA: 50S ribosomal protein L20 [Candidatus Krumholzibacteriaceae bacterium]|nr:50S ribosomal protein L20 [Candidatus Krumholzibacteriaceae bacterium]